MADGLMGHTASNGVLNPEVSAKPKRRQFSADFKRRLLERAAEVQAAGGNVGEFLRKEGLYWSQLAGWRRAAASGDAPKKRGRPATSTTTRKLEARQQSRRVASLERELKQARAIIELQKKVAEFMATLEAPNAESSS